MSSRFYYCTLSQPTSVLGAISGNFIEGLDEILVTNLGLRLEFYTYTDLSINTVLSVPVHSRIHYLSTIKIKNRKDKIFLLTEDYDFAVISISVDRTVTTHKSGSLLDRIGRSLDEIAMAKVDPLMRYVAIHFLQGLITVVPLDVAIGQVALEPATLRIPDLSIVSFDLYPDSPAGMAILHRGINSEYHLIRKQLDLTIPSFAEFENLLSSSQVFQKIYILPNKLGILLFSESEIRIVTSKNNFISYPLVNLEVADLCWLDIHALRMLIADKKGVLFLLSFSMSENAVAQVHLEILGVTSFPSCILYLGNGLVFIGSFLGDSQFLKLQTEKQEDGCYFSVIETLTAMGPIISGLAADVNGVGIDQMFVSSGFQKYSSIKILTGGMAGKKLALVDLPDRVEDAWSLGAFGTQTFHSHLALSYWNHSWLLKLGIEDLERIEVSGFDESSCSLLCVDVGPSVVVQVTTKGARLFSLQSGELLDAWASGSLVTAASYCDQTLAVVCGGERIAILDLDDRNLSHRRTQQTHFQISGIHLCSSPSGVICYAGLWETPGIISFRTADGLVLQEARLSSIPRSIITANLSARPYLFLSLSSGLVECRPLDGETFADPQQSFYLGSIPCKFFSSEDKLYSISESSSFIQSGPGHVLTVCSISPLSITALCAVNTLNMPDCLFVSRLGDSSFLRFDKSANKIQGFSHPIGHTVRKIAHLPSTTTCAVVSIEDGPQASSMLSLFDPRGMKQLDKLFLSPGISAGALCAVQRAETPLYLVGSGIPSNDSFKGEIQSFCINEFKLIPLHVLKCEEIVVCIEAVREHAVACIGQKVCLVAIDQDGLRIVKSVVGSILPMHLSVYDDLIGVGDLMRSVSLLKYRENPDGTLDITEICRDYKAHYVTCLSVIDDRQIIVAENSFSIYQLERIVDGPEPEQRQLHTVASMRTGHFFNGVFKAKISRETSSRTRLMLTSASGAIAGLLSLTNSEHQMLSKLQKALTSRVTSGIFNYSKWRKYESDAKKETCFIDGDLLIEFMRLDDKEKQSIIKEAGDYSIEKILGLLLELS